jgi:CubicO group peptidase (beta-lactamase class C family)
MIINIKKKLVFSAFFVALSSSASLAEYGSEYFYKNWRLPPYKTAIVNKGSSHTKPLPTKEVFDQADLDAIAKVKVITQNEPMLALLLIDNDNNLIFESYSDGATKDTLLKGLSMTKSLVSVAIGQSLCDRSIKSLGDNASKYSDTLQGTAYGDATIKELLMMASSGTVASDEGMPVKNMNYDLAVTHNRDLRKSFIEFGKNQPNPANKDSFSYKGLDTAALSIVLADNKKTKFQNILSKDVWTKIGAEKDGEIVVDKNNDALAESGFGATARDWGRAAIFIRDSEKSNTCLGDYIKDATSGQIINSSEHGKLFGKYGYQFWTDNKLVKAKAAWFNGYGGQRIGIDFSSGKIIVMLSYKQGAVESIYKVFDEWTSR